jgi:hypothetical protein
MVARRELLEVEAIIVAYAMSRLDDVFLQTFSCASWRWAFESLGERLGVRPASLKNLRDEFDPIHPNSRRGWHQRPLRPNRQRVLAQFCDASDQALIEVVRRILGGDELVRSLVAEPIVQARDRIENVAERLRTGRLAEEYFLSHSEALCEVLRRDLIDRRLDACGFDFGVNGQPHLAIEVKGIKGQRGDILFTDHEWQQANRRQADYWLVVVGCLENEPCGNLFRNPADTLRVTCNIRTTTAIAWQSKVTLQC